MKRLLNISTHPGEPEMFNDDRREAGRFLESRQFDGFELYHVGDYPCERIPAELVTGLHMRFFAILAPIWRGDEKRLLEIFGDHQTIDLLLRRPGRRMDRGLLRPSTRSGRPAGV